MSMKNMKLTVKLMLGFGVVLVLTAVVAFMGYNGLNQVARSVDLADDANRMVKDMLDCRREEKNFTIRGFTLWGSDTQSADQKCDAVIAEFETQIEETTAKLTDQEDLAALAQINQDLAAYKAAFDEYVAEERDKEEHDADMVAAAGTVIEVVEEMRADQKEKLNTEIDAGADATAIKDRLQKADDANRLIKSMLDARRHEKNYMLRHEQQYVDNVENDIAAMLTLLNDMKVRFQDAANDAQVDDILTELQAYHLAFEDYVDAVETQYTQEAVMTEVARTLTDEAEDMRAHEKEAMLSAESSATTMALGAAAIAIVVGIVFALVITRSITGPVASLQRIAEQVAKGDVQVAVDIEQKDEIGQLADAFREVTDALRAKAEAAEQIAQGNLAIEVPVASELDTLGNAMVAMKDSISAMAGDVNVLVEAAVAGKLDARADASKFGGEYAGIVGGINRTLDAVIGTLNVAAEYVDRISKGDIPDKITDE